jgi:integrase
MKKDGLADKTIKSRVYLLKNLLKLGADLDNPDSVETILATSNWTNGYKKNYIDSYKAYTIFKGMEWKKPKCIVPHKEPFLPTDKEITQLISACSKRIATLLKFLYDTGARIGEAVLTEWTDIDFKAKTVRINCPEKNSNARTVKLSDSTIALLKALKMRPDNKIFNPRTETLYTSFLRMRTRIAERLQNPRIKKIHFHTFRHLKATMEYAKTKDIKYVKYILGHKRLDTTDLYTHLIHFHEDEYTTVIAKTPEECCKLAQSGFVKFDEFDGMRLYKKRK